MDVQDLTKKAKSTVEYVPLKTLSLAKHPVLTERWLEDVIAQDPKILGIGDVVLKDRQRPQPRAGRLDLLLQDADGYGRYEVEIQLGSTDGSHIIRTLEYWDIERKRYPQYEHTAVIVAEDITSRFLNVISLFNGSIPIIALQVSAIQTSDGVGLHFTKVLDAVQLGFVDEDEPLDEAVDRTYWETKATKQTVKLADVVLSLIQEHVVDSREVDVALSYNKHYIGLRLDGRPFNFAILKPQRSGMRLEIRMPKSAEVDEIIETAGLDILDYQPRGKMYRLKLDQKDMTDHAQVLVDLLQRAYQLRA